MANITKAIVPIAGLATRFLPLSKVIPKELLPIAGKPMVQYVLEEAKASGVKEVIFVVSNQKKLLCSYFNKNLELEKILEERNQQDRLEELRNLEKILDGISFTFVVDQKPKGDGHAVLQAVKQTKGEPCFMMYPDDIIESSVPCVLQLSRVFATSQKPVISLFSLPKEKLSSYGVVEAEKIASRFWKIKAIVEKPKQDPPSNLVIAGRQVITPEVFDALKKATPNKKGEISLTEALGDMVRDGIAVYGYEVEGRWWEAGNKKEWLYTNLYYSLKHSEYGKEFATFLKEEKLTM